MRIAIGALALLACATLAHAEVIYVDIDATGADDGTSWADAYVDLQDALGRSVAGDEVWVAEGAYRSTRGTDREATFLVPRGVHLAGGFAGGESTIEDRNWTAHETVLTGAIGGSHWQDNSYCVVEIAPGPDPVIVSGVSIRRAFAEPGFSFPGGGLFCDSGEVELAHVTFYMNYGGSRGGGANIRNSSVEMDDVRFILNRAGSSKGGGLALTGCDAWITNSVFEGNSGNAGGGISATLSSLTVVNSLFVGNRADRWLGDGGAIYLDSSDCRIANATFVDNICHDHGGALWTYISDLDATNCVFWGNHNPTWNGGPTDIDGGHFSELRVASSIVPGSNSVPQFWEEFSAIDGGGNIDADPEFEDYEGHNLRLSGLSPAINAGNTTALPPNVLLDLDSNPRVYGSAVDMGAYEFQGPSAFDLFAAEVTPKTLNLNNNGRSVQVKLRPLSTMSPTEIDQGTVVILDSIAPLPGGVKAVRGHFRAKFPRADVVAVLSPGTAVPIRVSGLLQDGSAFVAVDTIRVIDPNAEGPVAWKKAQSIDIHQTVTPHRYLHASPNPFNPSTTIYYGVPDAGYVTLAVYDMAGRKVKSLVSEHVTAGDHEVSWDGRDEAGRRVASGVYLYQLRADEFVESKRMVLVK